MRGVDQYRSSAECVCWLLLCISSIHTALIRGKGGHLEEYSAQSKDYKLPACFDSGPNGFITCTFPQPIRAQRLPTWHTFLSKAHMINLRNELSHVQIECVYGSQVAPSAPADVHLHASLKNAMTV
eukprot:1159045-Pelagomonas_calceolata.AAC.6